MGAKSMLRLLVAVLLSCYVINAENAKDYPARAASALTNVLERLHSGNVTAAEQQALATLIASAEGRDTPLETPTPSASERAAWSDGEEWKLVWSDEFNGRLDHTKWKHEITAGGGGNWEFEYYINNRTNSFIRNGTLFLKPTLTADTMDITKAQLDLWGGGPADRCTSNAFYGCQRTGGVGGNVLNPVQSARLRTAETFSFQYGKIEVRAKLPRGDWLWPAIWLLPRYQQYGLWPASGEIDIMEARGNDASYPAGGVNKMGSTIHWGPFFGDGMDKYPLTHAEATAPSGDFSTSFHTFGLIWTPTLIQTYIDSPSNVVLNVPINQSFWDLGGFSKQNINNPWEGGGQDAPFDQPFYLILNVACGGTNTYFPDGVGGKPWNNKSPSAANDFWAAKDKWYPTWKGDDAAMQVDYVRVYQQAQ